MNGPPGSLPAPVDDKKREEDAEPTGVRVRRLALSPPPPFRLDSIQPGPRVPDHLITAALIDAFAELYGRRPEPEQLLREATRMRLELDPAATYIKAGHVPDISSSGANAYWHEVFHEACRHGPRMVGAILLAATATTDAFPDAAQRDCARLLRFLLTSSRS